jgi:hypothetical protein
VYFSSCASLRFVPPYGSDAPLIPFYFYFIQLLAAQRVLDVQPARGGGAAGRGCAGAAGAEEVGEGW